MPEIVTIAAVVAVVVLIAAVVLQARRQPAAGSSVSKEDLQEIVAAALAGQVGADRVQTSHADSQLVDTPLADSPLADPSRVEPPSPARTPGAPAAANDRDRLARELADAQRQRDTLQATAADLTRRSAEASERLAVERAEVRRARAELDTDRKRLADQARDAADAAVTTDRAEVQNAQLRLQSARDALADDQRRLEADRERTRSDETEIERAREKVAALRESVHLQTEGLVTREAGIEERRAALDDRERALEGELSRISGLTPEHARAELMDRERERSQREAALMVRAIEAEAEAGAKQKARAIVADAIQRVASDQTAQTVVSVLHLPSDDVKGRIIGREGRNIRAFETITGVNVIIDDTPEAVLLSCFDPVRREIGRVTLESLIEDGRIHPHRIEEAYLRAHDEVEARCARAAQDALLEVGVSGLHPELQKLVGQLKYRTSYGQNVLGHLVETALIAGGMASELGLDPKIVIRGAFLHDIGKALTHEAQGSHAIVGAALARRYGESDDVAHCIEAHHDEVAPATVEAVLTQAADSCSGGRPGARRESLESYVQRLERIESIASSKKGVEKVFAMQAGRELRVMVKPDLVDDLEAHVLAREVAKQIEEELTYPGQVRVTVIRESRATEVAR